MDHIAVANKTVTPNAVSDALAKNGIKVIVSTLHWDSQRPADAPLPTRGPPLFFSEEAELNIAEAVVVMKLLKLYVTCHNIISVANSMQKVNTTVKIFQNKSVSEEWYQACLS